MILTSFPFSDVNILQPGLACGDANLPGVAPLHWCVPWPSKLAGFNPLWAYPEGADVPWPRPGTLTYSGKGKGKGKGPTPGHLPWPVALAGPSQTRLAKAKAKIVARRIQRQRQ